MIELVICLGLLALAVILLTSFFVSLYRSADKSGNTAAGIRVAETVINQQLHDIFKGLHPAITKASFFATDASPGLTGNLQLDQTEFQYQMDYVTVQANGGGGDLGASLSGNKLKSVVVTCWWWGPTPNAQRAGQGKLSVRLQRLVNENDEF